MSGAVQLVSTPTSDNQDGGALVVPLPTRTTFDSVTITISGVFQQVTGSSGLHDHDLTINATDSAVSSLDNRVYCGLELNERNSPPTHELTLTDFGNLQQHPLLNWQPNTEYLIMLNYKNPNYTCTVTGPNGIPPRSGTSSLTPRNNTAFSIYAFGSQSQINSVFVVGPP